MTDFTGLPFVRQRKRGRHEFIDHWAVEPSGDFLTDFKMGRDFAVAFLTLDARQKAEGIPGYRLHNIVRAQIAAGRDDTVVFGFHKGLADVLDLAARTYPDLGKRLREHYHRADEREKAAVAAYRKSEKARRSEQARKAANARWAKAKRPRKTGRRAVRGDAS